MNDLSIQRRKQIAPREADQEYLDTLHAEIAEASEDDVLSAVSALLQCFPAQQIDVASARMKARGYLVGLKGVSLIGLKKGCEAWLQGMSLDGRRFNFAFAPAPGELRQLCDHFDGPTRDRIERVMARPKPLVMLPRPVPSDEDIARRMAQVEDLKRQLDKATEELKVEEDERRKRYLETAAKGAAARLQSEVAGTP